MHDLSREKHWIVLYLLITFGLDSVASGVGPTEVVLWEDPGYSGPSFNYSINTNRGDATQDIYAVFALNDKISSVEVGSDVKVAFYRHNFFCGPSKVFEGSVPYLGNYWNDQMSSLIIFSKDYDFPPGVILSETAPNTVTGFEPETQFFPLIEYIGETNEETAYYDIRTDYTGYPYNNLDFEYVIIQGDVEAEIFGERNLQGPSIVLPAIANVCSKEAESEYNGNKFYRLSGCVLKNVASLKVRQMEPKDRSSSMGTSAGGFISEPGSYQTTTSKGSAPRIVDVSWKPNIRAIEVTFDQFPVDLWSEQWEMYIDNQKKLVAAPQGSPNVRPNAALDQHPTGVLVGTLPWLSSLDATDFPCCGTIRFCIPGIGCTNEMEFNLAGEGCRTASPKNCGSGQQSQTQEAQPVGSSDVITGLVVGISEIPVDSSPSPSTGIELEYDVDRPGMNVMQGYVLSSPDPWICANDWFHNPECNAFTYVKPGFSYADSPCECWLKNGVPDPVTQEYCVSGVK